MIKQIQLRGISRTPSDRMNEDGGLSESLNMYLDSSESAPAFMPDDITEELGLPFNISADLVFIHKTASYEHTLFVNKGVLSYASENGIEKVFTLEAGDKINNISSIGNSIIATGEKNTYYALYKEGAYIDLGTAVPFPIVNIFTTDSSVVESPSPAKVGWSMDSFTSVADFNAATEGTKGTIRKNLSANLHSYFSETVNTYLTNNKFIGIRFIRYAIELFDDSLLSSEPIMVGGFPYLQSKRRTANNEFVVTHNVTFNSYSINLRLQDKDFAKGWEDIVRSVKLYISAPVIPSQQEDLAELTNFNKSGDDIDATINFASLFEDSEEIMTNAAFCHEIASIPIFAEDKFQSEVYTEEYNNLCTQYTIEGSKEYDTTTLDPLPLLEKDDSQHFRTIFKNHSVYNGRLLGLAPISKLELKYPYFPHRSSSTSTEKLFLLQFLLHTDSGKVVVQKEMLGECDLKYIFFPDSRCYQVDVFSLATNRKVSYEMKKFTFLKGAYYLDENLISGGSIRDLANTLFSEGVPGELSDSTAYDIRDNYIYMSKLDNLFTFADENKYRFQSSVVGAAVASTALSQGQFGQFPLYVFTEDGIWAMETGADGAFVSSKPLSREVCSNPDSITSIDNAVVFITKKAVMVIQGADVINLSPSMNGRHFIPNEDAVNVVGEQGGFAPLVSAIVDDDPFMRFMQDAKITYDYTGKRLIFISSSNRDYHYVYMLDTKTWHKLSFDRCTLLDPLNSYPDCLVRGAAIKELYWNNWDGNMPEEELEQTETAVYYSFGSVGIALTHQEVRSFIYGDYGVDVSSLSESAFNRLNSEVRTEGLYPELRDTNLTRVYSLGTVLDASITQDTANGILITRPFDLGEPDVYKTIKTIKIRGDFEKGNVKYFVQGSDDGRTFYNLNSLRGKSWKMFRLFILANLKPTERISWVDIEYDSRFKNRLR